MTERLPSLQQLRVFDTAAKTLSFKLAAERLNVTPSAVSHQIKSLEQQLQFPLFVRLNRSLTLNQAGEALHEVVSLHLAQMESGVEAVIKRFSAPAIRANILPFMATEIVIPNLHSFQSKHPDIALRIETSFNDTQPFNLLNCDLSIRFGDGNWPGLKAEKLTDITVTPVCSPQFREQENLQTLQDIRGKTLINLPITPHPWERLAKESGLAPLPPHQELTLDSYVSNLAAAEQSLGLALGLLPTVGLWLKKQRLVAPFDIQFLLDDAYWVVYKPEEANRQEVQLFVEWLHLQFTFLKSTSDEFYSSEMRKVSFVEK